MGYVFPSSLLYLFGLSPFVCVYFVCSLCVRFFFIYFIRSLVRSFFMGYLVLSFFLVSFVLFVYFLCSSVCLSVLFLVSVSRLISLCIYFVRSLFPSFFRDCVLSGICVSCIVIFFIYIVFVSFGRPFVR